ncbi:MAG TPA: ribosome silencing factor [Candidatus Acidoferrales bacterium]|nr:ribosome silencing factor [Candidatus Acidoferrales bacterium]
MPAKNPARGEEKTMQYKIAELALTKKARDVVILELRRLTSMTDYFVVCTGDSETQVKAIANAIMYGMEELGEKAWHVEGMQNLQWVLLDYVDVVVHIFHKDARSFYGLEKLWGDAKVQRVADAASPARSRKSGGTTRRKKSIDVERAAE